MQVGDTNILLHRVLSVSGANCLPLILCTCIMSLSLVRLGVQTNTLYCHCAPRSTMRPERKWGTNASKRRLHYADNTNVEKGDILQPLLLQHALWDYVISETESRGNVKVEANIKLESRFMFESKSPCSKPFFNKRPKWRVENRVRTQIRDRNRQQGTVAEIRRFSTGSNFGKNMQTHMLETLHSDTKESLSGE